MQRVMFALFLLIFMGLGAGGSALAASEQQTPASGLLLFTSYPSVSAAINDTISFPLVLRADTPQIAKLAIHDLPKDWTATLRGDGRIIQSAFVTPGTDAKVDLRIEPPKGVAAGSYQFTVSANGVVEADLPLEVVLQDRLPPNLAFVSDLPTIRGAPESAFHFNTTLHNQSDADMSVDLTSQAPQGFDISFSSSGQNVTSLPIEANGTKSVEVTAQAPQGVTDGSFPIQVHAQGNGVASDLTLTAQIVGQSSIALTTPDGRLSGDATIGASTPFQLVVRNSGSAPAHDITVNASPPSGWNVDLEPAKIAAIPPGQEVTVTANVRPGDQAIAGDYVVNFSAAPAEGRSASADIRVTVLTSTLWGIAGFGLIAAAVVIVGLAVARFGRR